MEIAILPNFVRDAITAKLDAAFIDCPQAEKERESLFNSLLDYFYKHGVIPEFKLTGTTK